MKFDGAQYRFDMLNLAVEEAMFVEDIYASCQVLVRAGDGRRIEQLQALVDMLQNRVEAPEWISDVMLCKQNASEINTKPFIQEIQEKIIWTEHRETLVKLLVNEKRLDRRVLIVGEDIHTLARLAKILSHTS